MMFFILLSFVLGVIIGACAIAFFLSAFEVKAKARPEPVRRVRRRQPSLDGVAVDGPRVVRRRGH